MIRLKLKTIMRVENCISLIFLVVSRASKKMSFPQIVSIFIAIFLFAQGEVSQSLPTLDDQSLNYRLPNNSVPLFYYLRIETDIHNGADDFLGLEKIRIRITETTDVITLHCNGEILKIKSVDLYDTQGNK